MQLFKILARKEWNAAKKAGVYRGSADDVRDGFIHLSTSAQLAETLSRHFAHATDLVLVSLDSDSLGAALKWEPGGHGTDFPHLYGEIDPSRVLWSEPIGLKSPGVFRLPVRAYVDRKDLLDRPS